MNRKVKLKIFAVLFVSKNSLLASIKNFSTPFFHRLWITFPTTLGKTGSFPQAIIFICVSAVYLSLIHISFDHGADDGASFQDNLMLSPFFADKLERTVPMLRRVCAGAMLSGVPVPAMSSAQMCIRDRF